MILAYILLMEDKKNKGGAPTKYREEYDEQVFKLCLLGATDVQLADFFNVCEDTIHNWKKKKPKFFESIKQGKADADANVANSLYNRALGYSHNEEKVFCQDGRIITHETKKHYPPDATSAIFWLKNRQPSEWRDKQEQSIDVNVKTTGVLVAPSEETPLEWAEKARKVKDNLNAKNDT